MSVVVAAEDGKKEIRKEGRRRGQPHECVPAMMLLR